MALSDELLEQIGAYLSGQMTSAEKDRFETRMHLDAGLRTEVTIQREIKHGLSVMAQKEQFKAMHRDLDGRGLLTNRPDSSRPSAGQPMSADFVPPPSAKPKRTLFRAQWAYFAMAAVLVLVLGFGWVIYRNQATPQTQLAQNTRTFDAFFSPDLRPLPVLSPDPDRVAAPPTGVRTNADPDSLRLHAAVLALRGSETQAAIDSLGVLTRAAPGHWSASAQWYLALAYLKSNQRRKAGQLTQQIAGLNGHPYQGEAKRLLGQLSGIPAQPR